MFQTTTHTTPKISGKKLGKMAFAFAFGIIPTMIMIFLHYA